MFFIRSIERYDADNGESGGNISIYGARHRDFIMTFLNMARWITNFRQIEDCFNGQRRQCLVGKGLTTILIQPVLVIISGVMGNVTKDV